MIYSLNCLIFRIVVMSMPLRKYILRLRVSLQSTSPTLRPDSVDMFVFPVPTDLQP